MKDDKPSDNRIEGASMWGERTQRQRSFWRWTQEKWERLRTYARRFRTGQSEDLVQAFFVAMLKKPSSFLKAIPQRTAFAFRAIRNGALNIYRGKRRERPLTVVEDCLDTRVQSDQAQSLGEMEESSQHAQFLKEALEYVPAEERALVNVIRSVDLTGEELAKRLGCSVAAARERKSVLLGRLRNLIQLLAAAEANGWAAGSLFRRIIGLRSGLRLSVEDLAKTMQCPRSQVMMWLDHLRKRLPSELKELV